MEKAQNKLDKEKQNGSKEVGEEGSIENLDQEEGEFEQEEGECE